MTRTTEPVLDGKDSFRVEVAGHDDLRPNAEDQRRRRRPLDAPVRLLCIEPDKMLPNPSSDLVDCSDKIHLAPL